MRISYLIFIVFLANTYTVNSSWIECRVDANVLEVNSKYISGEDARVKVEVLSSEVIDGFAEPGTSCFESGTILEISPEKNQYSQELVVKAGTKILLRYYQYNAMTPNGEGVSVTTWTYLME